MASFLLFLYALFIDPIVNIIAGILNVLNAFGIGHGWDIIVLSLVVNTLILPLYAVSERIQAKERAVRGRLDSVVDRLKMVYKGVTLHFLVQYWYKQQGYHPIFALRSLFGFLIQVPFFIAAYQYLGHWQALENQSFLFLKDLAKPDGLLLGLNLLPFLMTALNLASAFFYAKNLRKSDKIQLIVISLVFFVLLYAMPSGLLLYWTLNNLYSLFKNIVTHAIPSKSFNFRWRVPGILNFIPKSRQPFLLRFSALIGWLDLFAWLGLLVSFYAYVYSYDIDLKHDRHSYLLRWCFIFLGYLAFNGFFSFFYKERRQEDLGSSCLYLVKSLLLFALLAKAFLIIIHTKMANPPFAYGVKVLRYDYGLFLLFLVSLYKYLPKLLRIIHKHLPPETLSAPERNALFIASAFLGIATLFLYAPLNIISSDLTSFSLALIKQAFYQYLSAGLSLFVLLGIVYLVLKKEAAYDLVLVLSLFSLAALLFNFLPIWHMNIGNMIIEKLPNLETIHFFYDALVCVFGILILYFFLKKKKATSLVWIYFIFAFSYASFAYYKQFKDEHLPWADRKRTAKFDGKISKDIFLKQIKLSTKDNIILIFTDRFYGGFMPLLLKDDPSIATKLDGFTWYANTGSYGPYTALGFPAALGGYHYEAVKWFKESPQQGDDIWSGFYSTAALLFESLFYNLHRNGYEVNASADWSLCSYFGSGEPDIEGTQYDNCLSFQEEINQYEGPIQKSFESSFVFSLSLIKMSPYVLKKILIYHWMNYDSTVLRKVFFKLSNFKDTCFSRNEADTKDCQLDIMKTQSLDLYNGEKVKLQLKDIKTPYFGLYRLSEKTLVDEKLPPQFVYIDSMLTHVPGIVNYDCNPNDTKPRDEEVKLFKNHNYTIGHFYAHKCAIFTVSRWFDLLKKEGVYDNSTILWYSDHGITDRFYDPQYMTTPPSGSSAASYDMDVGAKGHFYPLLMVKPKKSRGALKTNNEPHMNADVVANFLCDLLSKPCYNPILKEPYIKTPPPGPYIVRGDMPWRPRGYRFYAIPRTGILNAPVYLERVETPPLK